MTTIRLKGLHHIPTITTYVPETSSLSARNGDIELIAAVQVYSPESLVSTELIVAVLMEVVAVILVATEVEVVNSVPGGPLHTVFTVTAMYTASLNSMEQVRVREEPVKIVPSGEAVTVTAVGGGTK